MRRIIVLTAILACAHITLPSVYAQSCSTSIQNAPGDSIGVTATLFTNDPNENGEGEPLQVFSSGGEISATIGAYSLPTPFSYQATAADETITGTIVGFDSDETCSITATVNGAPAFTPAQKTTANHVAGAGGVLSVVLGVTFALSCVPPFTPVCIGVALVGAGGGLTWAIGGTIAGDPSDPNFMVIAVPNIAAIAPLVPGGGLTAAEANAFNALIANQAAIVGIGTAAITAANRAQGAHDAGNTFWETRQIQAAQLYATQLGPLYSSEVDLYKQLHDALLAAGVSVNITSADVLQFEQQVASGGLPASWLQALAQFGASQDLINSVKQLLIVQNINTASGNFPAVLVSPDLITALQDVAAAFSGVGVVINHPINPQSNGLIPVVILGSSTFDTANVNLSSIRFGPNGVQDSGGATFADVNGDGLRDLVLNFHTGETGITCGSTSAVVTGKTANKEMFSGAGAIRLVGCH